MRDGVELVRRDPPDVVLMDIRMPVMDGIEATERIVEQSGTDGATPRVIVLTTFDLDEAATRAIRGGASGFLLKDADPEFLLAAIRDRARRHRGGRPVGDARAVPAFRRLASDALPPTPRRSAPSRRASARSSTLAARGLSNCRDRRSTSSSARRP